jgi:Bacteriophage tail sheath protein
MAVGVVVQRAAAAGSLFPVPVPSASYFVAGLAERGPATDVSRVTSLAQFEAIYGVRPSYGNLYDDIQTFFSEGGGEAYVARVVGPAATQGALATPLNDRAGTPLPTLQITAKGPGAWSSSVAITITNGTVPNTFTISIVYLGVEVDRYVNLTSPQDAVTKMAGSAWVSVTDLASATAAPNNNPAVASSVSLSAGSDDRGSVDAAAYVAALTRFGSQLGDGCVAIPGGGDATHTGLIAHAADNNRVAILASSRNASSTQLATLAAGYNSEYAGLFGPWVQTRDVFGGIRAIPPEGYVAAVRARAHRDVGPWQAPAGERARSSIVVAPDQIFDATTANALEDAKVNPILATSGGVRLYGWRSLSADTANWRLLTGIDVINRIVVAAKAALESLVFGTIDSKGHLLAKVEGALTGIVRPMADLGGLYAWVDADINGGNPIERDPGFAITTDPSREVASANMVIASVAVRVAPTGALIQLTVTKVGVTRRF